MKKINFIHFLGKYFLLMLLYNASLFAGTLSNFSFENKPGPYAVGMLAVHQYDYNRCNIYEFPGQPVIGERARPIQTLIWYPAEMSRKPMTYGDYRLFAFTKVKFERTKDEIASDIKELVVQIPGLSEEQLAFENARLMWAVRDAKPISGKFPVVIYAPSFNSNAFENADLCEYLASYGYIVLSSPSIGAHTLRMTQDLEGLEAQVGDIEFLIGYARTLPNVDIGQIAVIGYSWGGLSNVLAAAWDERIKALVCLDGTVRYQPIRVDEAKYVTPARLKVPLLFLAQRRGSLENQIKNRPDLNSSFLIKMKYADVQIITFNPMRHGNFGADFNRFFPKEFFDEYSCAEVSQAYGWMARYVLEFLNTNLKNDTKARTFMKNSPKENDVPAHWLTMETFPVRGVTIEMLADEVQHRGFQHTLEAYKEAKQKDADFKLEEKDLNDWGYGLLNLKKIKEAIEIFSLNVYLHPESENTYDSLAEAYERCGNKKSAIKNYKRSLQLNPQNQNAVKHLETLESSGSGSGSK